jgi:hypothetical protein
MKVRRELGGGLKTVLWIVFALRVHGAALPMS